MTPISNPGLLKSRIYLLLSFFILFTAGFPRCSPEQMADEDRHVLFIAGAPSHGFGNHEHLGGSTLLAQTIDDAGVGVRTTVISGWPEDESIFDDVGSVVIYSNGVEPISIRDEWYYHMRFTDGMQNVSPILTDLPPEESLSRDDGPHSGNPHVRQAVIENSEEQHVAWAYERPNGGRSFGFTGGHYHWNWGHDQFRRLAVNAIVWSAGTDVPANGLPVNPVNVLELAELTDDPIPDDWDYQPIQNMLDEANNRNTQLP